MQDQSVIFSLKKSSNHALLSASIELKKACRTARCQPATQELFARWPNLREASQRLASLLTIHWPDQREEGRSLLVSCLANGLSAAEQEFEVDNNDLDEQRAFICQVSDELVQCLGLTLMIKLKGGWTAYDPNTGGFLDEVINSSASEELVWIDKSNEAFNSPQSKILVASRVFTMRELKLAGLLEK
jgi:hypothetical protein